MRQWPLVNRFDIDAAHEQIFCLAAVVQVQKPLEHRRRAGRVILHENVRRAVQVRMLKVKRYLVGAQGYLAPLLHYLQLHHHKHPLPRQGHQAVRRPQIHPALDPRNVTVW